MSRRSAVAVFLASLLLRLGYLGLVYEGPDSLRRPDSPSYETYAAWLAGEIPPGEKPTRTLAVRTPGYPALLAAFRLSLGADPLWPVLGQALLDSLTCVLVAWLAATLNPRLGLLAGLLAAANLNMIAVSALLLSETCFLFLLVASLLAVVRFMDRPGAGLAAIAGLAFGASLLVRPAFQYFPPLLIGTLFVAARGRHIGAPRAAAYAALAALAIVLTVMPRLVHNAREFGHASLSSAAGTHLLRWTLPQTRRWAEGVPAEQGQQEAMQRLQSELARQGLEGPSANPFEAGRQKAEVAQAALWEVGLAGMLEAWALSIPVLMAAPSLVGVPQIARLERSSYLSWLAIGGLFTAALRLLQLTGLTRIGRAGGLAVGPSVYLLVVAAYIVVVGGPYAKTVIRYRIPVEPLLVILLAAGIDWTATALRRRRRASLAAPGQPKR